MDKRGALTSWLNKFQDIFSNLLSKRSSSSNCYATLNSTRVRDIMVKDVLCIKKDDKLTEAAHIMIGAHASCLVVLLGEKPIGIITERDFVKKLDMNKNEAHDLIVQDIMTKQLFSVNSSQSLIEAQKIMREHKFRKLLIVENDSLKGIITQTDLCWAVADLNVRYKQPPLVESIMSKKVFMISQDDKFLKAKKLMAVNDVGSVLVVSKGEVKGMFTEFDLVSEFFMNPNRLKHSYMSELMTNPVVCISPDFDVFQINKIMLKHNFRRLPVVKNNKLVGVVTQTDVAKSLYEFIEKNKTIECDKGFKQDKEPLYCIKKAGCMILYEKKIEDKPEPKKA